MFITGIQSLFVNGDTFFLPPPLNQYVGSILCENRQFGYDMVEAYMQQNESEADLVQRVKLESLPLFRLLSALIQKKYLYSVAVA